MKICITGGAGYVGSALVPHFLKKGHDLTVLDTFWYGDCLRRSLYLKKIVGDIRDYETLKKAFRGQDAVVHLACVSNDPSFELNPNLGKEINYDAFKDILRVLHEENVARFIYASSSSVYGVSDRPDITEEAQKNPLTDYSKYKLACETWLKGYGTGGVWTILRPATVCGYAPRLRLDVVVNMLTIQALVNKKITITNRNLLRPNININDMVAAYDFVLNKDPKYIDQRIWNVGFENLSLYEIAVTVKKALGDPDVQIIEQPNKDNRSYHINSGKIRDVGFSPSFSIKDAAKSIKKAYSAGLLNKPLENPIYSNVKMMKALGVK